MYPKFARLDDQLVKIGWSKKTKREYQHKAPRYVVDLLVKRVLDEGADGTLFTTDELFALYDHDQDTDVPSYQAYVCLAWLRTQGLIQQVGRQGYRVVRPMDLQEAVNREWNVLAKMENLNERAKGRRKN